MIDIDQLPIPDWGLHCPSCGASLAGLQDHVCTACGKAFDIRAVLETHRPIADIGLTCPMCGYLLTGLMVDRCPECNTGFSVRDLIEERRSTAATYSLQLGDPSDHHIKKREPVFTGRERPLPNFGLSCGHCRAPLMGAPEDSCPACGRSFDVFAVIPEGEWVDVSAFVHPGFLSLAKVALYGNGVPYLIDNARLNVMYGGNPPVASGKLRVPRSFFFDALHTFAAANEPSPLYALVEWICPACREAVPAGFEICWNCGASHPDSPLDE